MYRDDKEKKLKMDLVKQLQEWRLEKRLSLQKLSKLMGVSTMTVNRWELGHFLPNKIQAYHIRKFLEKHKIKK